MHATFSHTHKVGNNGINANFRFRYICSFLHYYRPQQSCGKVMFLHLSVILSTGGACMPPHRACPPAMHASLPCTPPATHAPCHAHPLAMHPPCNACPSATHAPDLGILRDVVNEQAVRILLECILVCILK